MRVGLISDTHMPRGSRMIPDEVLSGLEGVDLILHAGDLVALEVLAPLERIAPVVAVAGNNDLPEVAERWGYRRELELAGYRVGLVHGHEGKGKSTPERALSTFAGFDVVVFGHSHSAYNQRHGKTLAVNPGSPTDKRRWSPGLSYALLYLEPDGVRAELRLLDGGAKGREQTPILDSGAECCEFEQHDEDECDGIHLHGENHHWLHILRGLGLS